MPLNRTRRSSPKGRWQKLIKSAVLAMAAAVALTLAPAGQAHATAPTNYRAVKWCPANTWTLVDDNWGFPGKTYSVDGNIAVQWRWYSTDFPWYVNGNFNGSAYLPPFPWPGAHSWMKFYCSQSTPVYLS
ncbi:hypothetical protein [Kitasatospora sp. DSM 101779]|uniref:hypothetical protein n=1 Tax=Kitasatospora sp. DSM 101779 TaxID=2853165 RepID=UPI0021D8A362|nr:hypothetical protein [Kitasatospora sp. DSM 101779]MCU7827299.1 hypothetical protein [Kitasatospora sp. DSM 101779]